MAAAWGDRGVYEQEVDWLNEATVRSLVSRLKLTASRGGNALKLDSLRRNIKQAIAKYCDQHPQVLEPDDEVRLRTRDPGSEASGRRRSLRKLPSRSTRSTPASSPERVADVIPVKSAHKHREKQGGDPSSVPPVEPKVAEAVASFMHFLHSQGDAGTNSTPRQVPSGKRHQEHSQRDAAKAKKRQVSRRREESDPSDSDPTSSSSSSSSEDYSEDDDVDDSAPAHARGGRRSHSDGLFAATGVTSSSSRRSKKRAKKKADLSQPFAEAYIDNVLSSPGVTTMLQGVKALNFNKTRNENEMLVLARIVDATRERDRRSVLEIATRRMAGVALADSTGSWTAADALAQDSSRSGYVPSHLLGQVAKWVSLQQSMTSLSKGDNGAGSAGRSSGYAANRPRRQSSPGAFVPAGASGPTGTGDARPQHNNGNNNNHNNHNHNNNNIGAPYVRHHANGGRGGSAQR